MFIVNPRAGGRNRLEEITDSVRRVMEDVVGFFEIRATLGKGGAESISREAVVNGFDTVIACGGDGTVNETATPLVGTDVALGILPFGSGNGLARTMGIPFEIDAAMKVVRSRKTRLIDVGMVCERYFFATAGFGFDAHLSKKYNEGAYSSITRGLLPYFPLALKEFYRYRPEEVLIKIENNQMKVTPFILTVANVDRYGGDAVISPGASPDDGLLDLCIVPKVGITNSYSLAKKLLSGEIDKLKGYKCIRAQNIEIYRVKSSVIHVDGEPFEWQGNILIKVLHKKLKLFVP